MTRSRRGADWTARLAVVVLSWTAGRAAAFSNGPPEQRTGAPGGESTCAGCHLLHLNTGSGLLRLLAPALYVPGDTLTLAVALQQAGQKRWGFELTALSALGRGGQILRAEPERTFLTMVGGRQYLKQNAVGTDAGTPDVAPGWRFEWVAPPSGTGTITFYVAGNAANGDGTHLGDFIYTIQHEIQESRTAVTSQSWSAIKSLYGSGRERTASR